MYTKTQEGKQTLNQEGALKFINDFLLEQESKDSSEQLNAIEEVKRVVEPPKPKIHREIVGVVLENFHWEVPEDLCGPQGIF